MNIICFGDSVTHAAGFAEADRWPSILQQRLEDAHPGRFKVYNRGVGAQTTALGNDRFETDVLALMPGLVLVEFGFNDAHTPAWTELPRVGLAEFRARLAEFHRVITARGGRCVLIVNHTTRKHDLPQGNGRTYEANLAPYNLAIRDLAAELDADTIDLPALMTAQHVDLDTFLAADGLHLTPAGNHVYADLVLAGLRRLGLPAED